MTLPFSRQMPASVEGEKALLSCILIDGAFSLSKALDAKITVDCFTTDLHRKMWKSILWLHNNNRAIDLVVLAEELKRKNKLDEIGGFSALVEVSNAQPTTAQFSYYLEQVREMYVLRALIDNAQQVQDLAYARSGNVEDYVAATHKILSIRHATQDIKTLEEASNNAIEHALRIVAGELKKEDKTLAWPWKKLNEQIGALNNGELAILAARPGVGKSSSARQCALKWCQEGEVLLFSREMPIGELPYLFAQQISGVSWRLFKRGQCLENQEKYFVDALREVGALKTLNIFDKDRTLSQVTARCKAVAQVKPVRAIIIDYLQRYDPQQERGENRDLALGRMSMAFKDLAIDLSIPVLLLAQVGRSVEREQREPRLSDLRESGNLEQDADRVIFIHAPEQNKRTGQLQSPNDGETSELYVEFLQAKGRGEGQHKSEMRFIRPTTTFKEYDD